MRQPKGLLPPRRVSLIAAALVIVATTAVMVSAASATTSSRRATIKVGLITKTDTNPFFVKMKQGAQKAATALGAQLLTAAGKIDGDAATQITAIENMTSAGVKGILITPSNDSVVPAIKKARKKGVLVIALDTPPNPASAVDALFATNNFTAGVLIGKYAKKLFAGKTAKIAMLDLFPGPSVGYLRHNGFLSGWGASGIKATDSTKYDTAPQVVCSADSFGDQAKGQTAMVTCLQKNPSINLVYTINEPAAAGAYTALKNAGKAGKVTIVSVDGGCAGVRNVRAGVIAATSQQYPLKMASLGVAAVVNYAKTGKKVHGYTDTGVNLITKKPVAGVPSKSLAFGLANCWG
ncbi:MAG: fructose transport system substrate-binding protein [Gaiellaceae bacterium]|nr:fructose transport system substrate-binding protein [Gaiellaceae bacterium]